jgi:hypothetical protein
VTIERISIVVLALIAVVMGANYVSATSRFLDANRAYDSLGLTLESFGYEDPETPFLVEFGVENPAGTEIEVLSIRLTLRAGLQSVGGGELFIRESLQPGETQVYAVPVRISDLTYMRRLEDDEISWLIRGEIQVRLDADMSPVWIQFSVRVITP